MSKRSLNDVRDLYLERTLDAMFNDGDGRAYCWVSYEDKAGRKYGSYKVVWKRCLEGRRYTLSRSAVQPRLIHILFTDEVYKTGKNMRSLVVPDEQGEI